MRVTGAQIVVHLLERLGVETVAGIPGGAILPLYEALDSSTIRHVLARHEQGAGFIAQGMARVSGKAGVCLATSGPGATNLVTALADARADSVPLIAITANVGRGLLGTDAFQEVDFFSLCLPVTKHNFLVEQTSDLFRVLPEAFRLAESPRPGPVAVDIPKDVLTGTVDLEAWPEVLAVSDRAFSSTAPEVSWLDEVSEALAAAERPVIYAGGGAAGSCQALRAWARREGIPVATTLMGLGLLEPGDPLFLGMLGMHGTPAANRALAESDWVLALGVRFDDRATGRVDRFCPGARVVHVDVDPAELGKNHRVDWAWVGDAGLFLAALLSRAPIRDRSGFEPGPVLRALAEAGGPDLIVTTDVGQHQMWAAQHFPVRAPGTFLTSGGLGTMGFGLPAAIGAALAGSGRVVCLTGDGSLLMNVQELATLAELDLPVTIVLFNNGGLGLVRQQQELFYGARYVASGLERGPDFPALARSFGLAAWKVGAALSVETAFAEAFAHPGPSLVEVPVARKSLVLPMVAPGAANTDALLARPVQEA